MAHQLVDAAGWEAVEDGGDFLSGGLFVVEGGEKGVGGGGVEFLEQGGGVGVDGLVDFVGQAAEEAVILAGDLANGAVVFLGQFEHGPEELFGVVGAVMVGVEMGWMTAGKPDELFNLPPPLGFDFGGVDSRKTAEELGEIGEAVVVGDQGGNLFRGRKGRAGGEDEVDAKAEVGGFFQGEGDVVGGVGEVHHAGRGADHTTEMGFTNAIRDWGGAAVVVGVND